MVIKTCPFCFSYKNVYMGCIHCKKKSSFKQELLFTLNRKVPYCSCNRKFVVRCSSCKNNLPEILTKRHKPFYIPVFGIPDSGHTTLHTVQMRKMMRDHGRMPVFSPITESTLSRFNKYSKCIFQDNIPPDKSLGTYFDEPMVWTAKKGIGKQPYLYFYNQTITPSIKSMPDVVYGANVIWFIIDPAQISNVRARFSGRQLDHMGHSPGSRLETEDVVDMIQRSAEWLRKSNGIKYGRIIRGYAAFIITKADTFFDELPLASTPSPHITNGVFEDADCSKVSTEVREWLINNGAEIIVKTAEENFRSDYIRYFAVSSCRNDDMIENYIDASAPNRVEDPLLWTMANLSLIKRV